MFCAQVELHERRGDTIPEGWGCDAQGKLTTNPKEVLSGGGLVPIGGSEATGRNPAEPSLLTCNMWGRKMRFTGDDFSEGLSPSSFRMMRCLASRMLQCLCLCVLLSSGGYKGFGLGMMVEVFCGILAGAQYSKHVRTWKVTDRVANLVCYLFIWDS